MQHIKNDVKTILGKVKEIFSLKTDTELAEKLGITKSFMSRLKAGERTFSATKMREIEVILYSEGYITSSYVQGEGDVMPSSKSHRSLDREANSKIISNVQGKCQLCRNNAPFFDNEGLPYLIVTTIFSDTEQSVSKDTPLVALCPNCFEKIKVLRSDTDIEFLRNL